MFILSQELFIFAATFAGLLYAGLLAFKIKNADPGSEAVRQITSYIREGASAFLKKEYTILGVFAFLVFIALGLLLNWQTGIAFLTGAVLSGFVGTIGMRVATDANGKTAWASKNSIHAGLKIAFASGTIMGLVTVSAGLLGIATLYLLLQDPVAIYGFGFGASVIALFARVGGGIYTKAADVGADLVGKVEKGIPEDDPRNPAVIADNVGDNVGDVAGMGADLFESYSSSIIAAMALGVAAVGIGGNQAIFPMIIAALGILASIAGHVTASLIKRGEPHVIMNIGVWSAAFFITATAFVAAKYLMGDVRFFYPIIAGLVAGILIGLITEFFTSAKYQPTRELSESSKTGAGTNIIAGLALGMKSVMLPVLITVGAILIAYKTGGVYGIAIAAVGMLSTLGITLAADTYGPVADNAAGIAEMAHLGEETRKNAETLDAVGNTTAAIGKGFAISSAALTATVLGASYIAAAGIDGINLANPYVLTGAFLGGLLPFIFSSLSMSAVGKAAFGIVNEVRRQWKEIPGLMEGKAKPDYARCVSISTEAALRQMILPGMLAIMAPVAVGLTLGKESLGAFLFGAIISGFMLAIMMSNAGGAWDNAKKHIEAGHFGGKGSDTHKAAVVGDTVGDPLKDTAGPSLNILIKLMAIIALIIVPLL